MSQPSGLILAAGRGERLRPAVAGLPKPLVELEGVTLLARQARELLEAGAATVSAIINAETAALIVKRQIGLPPELSLVVRNTLNSMETLLAAADYLRCEHFLAATVDAALGAGEFKKFARGAALAVDFNSSLRFDGAIGLTRWRGDCKPLFAQIDSEARITELGATQSNLVTAGVYYLPSRIFEFADNARRAGLGALREFLALLLREGVRLKGISIDHVIDIDEPADLAGALELRSSGGIR
jgi:NDP-sugar pyrophosphorylase family protein